MRVYIRSLCLFLALAGVAFAQDETEPNAKASKETLSTSDLSEHEAAFRELVCARAADFSSPLQASAISIVSSRNYVDERFDGVLYNVVRESSKPETWDPKLLATALRLLPHSTLDRKVRAKLALECFNCSCKKNEDRKSRDVMNVIERALKFLKQYPDELTELLEEGLKSNDLPRHSYALMDQIGGSADRLLPLVIEAARGEQEHSEAMNAAGGMLLRIEAKQAKSDGSQADATKTAAEEIGNPIVDPRLIEYAERIVQRHDKNKDGVLDQSESDVMLMKPPKSCDTNKDGVVTAVEYSRYLQSRSKRK